MTSDWFLIATNHSKVGLIATNHSKVGFDFDQSHARVCCTNSFSGPVHAGEGVQATAPAHDHGVRVPHRDQQGGPERAAPPHRGPRAGERGGGRARVAVDAGRMRTPL